MVGVDVGWLLGCEGRAVGKSEGFDVVGDGDGLKVGSADGAFVGDSVGSCDGHVVGSCVGDGDGDVVGSGLGGRVGKWCWDGEMFR